jgi:hypothetical protein
MDFSSHFLNIFYSSSARKKDFFINFHCIFYDKQRVIINCMKMRIFCSDKKVKFSLMLVFCFPRQWFAEKLWKVIFCVDFNYFWWFLMIITLKYFQKSEFKDSPHHQPPLPQPQKTHPINHPLTAQTFTNLKDINNKKQKLLRRKPHFGTCSCSYIHHCV